MKWMGVRLQDHHQHTRSGDDGDGNDGDDHSGDDELSSRQTRERTRSLKGSARALMAALAGKK
jgi:hypothetical protein